MSTHDDDSHTITYYRVKRLRAAIELAKIPFASNNVPVAQLVFWLSERKMKTLSGQVGLEMELTLTRASLWELRVFEVFILDALLRGGIHSAIWLAKLTNGLRELLITEYLDSSDSSPEFDRLYAITADRASEYAKRFNDTHSGATFFNQNLLHAETGEIGGSPGRHIIISNAFTTSMPLMALFTPFALCSMRAYEPLAKLKSDLASLPEKDVRELVLIGKDAASKAFGEMKQ